MGVRVAVGETRVGVRTVCVEVAGRVLDGWGGGGEVGEEAASAGRFVAGACNGVQAADNSRHSIRRMTGSRLKTLVVIPARQDELKNLL